MTDGQGLTPTERYLSRLCRRSFLSLWSFPNLYTDEGRKSSNAPGHELCDLLVVFGNDVIIFSDKSVHFNSGKPIDVAWRRWYRKAIRKSVAQLYGAESWILRYPNRIYLEPQCVNPLPVKLPGSEKLRVHRVAVATGAYDACREYFGGASIGSLMIASDLQASDHGNSPFTIGQICPAKGFVHVFEEFSLDAVFAEVDTTADFIAYMQKRETFLTRPKPIIRAAGEEQLLSIYLTRMNNHGEHDFVLPVSGSEDVDFVALDESFWQEMVDNPQYHAKKKADKISYAWDRLIEHFAELGARYNEDSERLDSNSELEHDLRHMAAESRLRRRQLALAFVDLLEKTAVGKRAVRVVYSNDRPEKAYVFLVLPTEDGKPYEEYREQRRAMLSAYCHVAKLKCNHASHIIGIATENYRAERASEDMIVLDVTEWTQERQNEASALQEEYGLLLDENVKMSSGTTLEYPNPLQHSRERASPTKGAKAARKKRRARSKMQKISRRKNSC